MSTTPRLNLPYIHSGQAQKEITHNEALTMLDVYINPVVQDIGIYTLPENAQNGMLFVIHHNPEQALQEHAGKIAQRLEPNQWRFVKPTKWMRVLLDNNGAMYIFNGNDWQLG